MRRKKSFLFSPFLVIFRKRERPNKRLTALDHSAIDAMISKKRRYAAMSKIELTSIYKRLVGKKGRSECFDV